MSTFTTFKLQERMEEVHNTIIGIPQPAPPSVFVENIIWLANAIASHEHSYLVYFSPDLIRRLIERLADYERLVESVCEEHHMTDGACFDMEAEMRDALDAAENAYMPAGSFFFAYKDKEYYSVLVDADGNLVEEFKYDQRMSDGRVFGSLREWYQEHDLAVNSIEVAVCMDAVDSRFPYRDGEYYHEEY
jgi:hypothetical protein